LEKIAWQHNIKTTNNALPWVLLLVSSSARLLVFVFSGGMNSGSSTTDTKAHATSTTNTEAAYTNKMAAIPDAQANAVIEDGMVKFYFASDKVDLTGNTQTMR
jgi:hypothetical protein